jgi:two-component system, NtrC family, nitrogen regulation sensor histidine kinase NtrY
VSHKVKFGAGIGLLTVLLSVVLYQGSFSTGEYSPTNPQQTYVFWGLSTLTFLLTVLLGFILFRDSIKLYVARRAGVEGSKIRTKILVGAVSLCFLPTMFLVLWSVEVLNRNLDKWFSRPAQSIRLNLADIAATLEKETQQRAAALALWLADADETQDFVKSGHLPAEFFAGACSGTGVERAWIQRTDGGQIMVCEAPQPPVGQKVQPRTPGKEVRGRAPVPGLGEAVVIVRMPLDLTETERVLRRQIADYDQLAATRKGTWRFYVQLLVLITLFVLFIAVWVALFLARQITGPVTALLDAARAVRGGNLSYRVRVAATDEFATLVRAFNEMTQDLETNRNELERRRRFIEAVLESIPTGVVSLDADGTVRLTNRAFHNIFPHAADPQHLAGLIPPDMGADLGRLLKSARRTGSSSRQLEFPVDGGSRHLSVTVAALSPAVTSGYVLVIEDTTDLLRAQQAEAWHEVARRIAHELKNPLTPIALSSQRIQRQIDKLNPPPEVRLIVEKCCDTIRREVDSVKTLADEFSQFARFPSAHPEKADLNAAVRDALAVFEGRLGGVTMRIDLAADLPPVFLDAGQFKRVVVNLVDNAAEAMRDAPYKELAISTSLAAPDTVELCISDTGCGISIEDKSKLFLPYYSTKQRGTGLGLAIVSNVVSEHRGTIRVEDNRPVGARFIIELPAYLSTGSEPQPRTTVAPG